VGHSPNGGGTAVAAWSAEHGVYIFLVKKQPDVGGVFTYF
jgi:hypothetical protein